MDMLDTMKQLQIQCWLLAAAETGRNTLSKGKTGNAQDEIPLDFLPQGRV